MADLSARYLGLKLRSPIIAGSSGLTGSLAGVRACADAGAGAVVLKSVFEEQIQADLHAQECEASDGADHPEAEAYVATYGRRQAVRDYLSTLEQCRASIDLPVIASIHCRAAGSWVQFARHAESAGADALELNVFVPPMDARRSSADVEAATFGVARAVRSEVRIPVSLKIGPYFSGFANTAALLAREVDGLVLFNRFVRLDIDLDRLTVTTTPSLSTAHELELPLRWIAVLAGRVGCDLAASTGVHDGAGAAKAILAGATVVQTCSALYQRGVGHLRAMNTELAAFMDGHGFQSLDDFRGRLAQREIEDPAVWERAQFMRVQAGVE